MSVPRWQPPCYADECEHPWGDHLSLSPAARFFARRLVTLTGCNRHYAASQAHQRQLQGRALNLAALMCEAGFVERSRYRRIPVALSDRINQQRERRGLARLPRKAIACPLTRFHPRTSI